MLNANHITVRFGGLVAVSDVSLAIQKGTIHSVIGPNGAGKSTLFNAISGMYKPAVGNILFKGDDITGLAPDAIARKGIGRTFQNIKLFSHLSVLENVMSGFHITTTSSLFDDLFHTRKQRKEAHAQEEQAISLLHEVGLSGVIYKPAGNLPYGAQRKLEIVRAIASNPALLLLDEPAAGMNPKETEELQNFIVELRDKGFTVLLIEHHVRMVMAIADAISVLDHGAKIAEGNREEIQSNEKVIEAYLGKSYGRRTK
jgi:branched-chain amino acid transport system ATP-binding protein